MLTSLLSNQVFAYYPDADLQGLSKEIDSLQFENIENLTFEKGLNSQKKLENTILKVQKMTPHEEQRYTKKMIKRSQKNVRKAKKVSKKLLKSNKLMRKLARKTGKTLERLKAQLKTISSASSTVNIKKEITEKINFAGGLLPYLESLRSYGSKSLETKSLGDDLAAAIFLLTIIVGSFIIGSLLLVVGLGVLAFGGGAATLVIGGVLFVIGSPFLLIVR